MSGSFSAGSDAPLRRAIGAAFVLLAGLPIGAVIEQTSVRESRAEVRIGLPEPGSRVTVEMTAGGLVLDLPDEARYPVDLGTLRGLLLNTEVRPGSPGRVRLSLQLAGSVVDRIEMEGASLVIGLSGRSRGAESPVSPDRSYRIGVDDRIQVSVNGKPELTQQVVVSASGTVSAPLVGEVSAEGLTTTELSSRLTDLLARDYLVDPRVDVQVLEYRSQWALVAGAVRIPGRVVLRGASNLKDVLADAGGFAEGAGDEIVISRSVQRSEGAQRIVVDRVAFESGAANPPLEHGDIVTVAETEYCHILGEVKNPSRVRVSRDLTLFRALSAVGGLGEWAQKKEIQILRADGRVEAFDLQKIQRGEEEDPKILGGDRIYVRRRFF